jgi:hypothetical protein
MDHVDNEGTTALMWACYNNIEKVSLELLKYPDKCKIDQIDDDGNTALIFACEKGADVVAIELLKYHNRCKLNQVDSEGNTALIWSCFNNKSHIALELLKYPNKCNIDHVNIHDNTAFIWALRNEMFTVVVELLKYSNKCTIDKIYDGICYTKLLIFACDHKMESLAMKLLEYPDRCNFSQVSYSGCTALMAARNNKMYDVALTILNNRGSKKMSKYCFSQISEILHEAGSKSFGMYDSSEFKIRQKELDAIEERIKKLSKDGECLMCCEITPHNIFLTKCKHVLCVCDMCVSMLDKKCPLCKTTSSIITGCFTV